MHGAGELFGIIPLGLGVGALLFWAGSAMLRRRESPSVSQSIRGFTILLLASGWINYGLLKQGPHGTGWAPALNVGLMIGLTVAATSVRFGSRLERKRIEAQGSGTPLGKMARRATVFFLLLGLVALVERLAGWTGPVFGWILVATYGALWIPAGVFWALRPEAGPVDPSVSQACRAGFFGLAIAGLVSVFHPFWSRSAWGVGIELGVWISAALLLCLAWAGTWFVPRTAILIVGLVASLGGLLVLAPL